MIVVTSLVSPLQPFQHLEMISAIPVQMVDDEQVRYPAQGVQTTFGLVIAHPFGMKCFCIGAMSETTCSDQPIDHSRMLK